MTTGARVADAVGATIDTGQEVRRHIPELDFQWPEIEARADQFKQCVRDYGCAVLRGAIQAERIDFYKTLVERASNQWKECCAEQGIDYRSAPDEWMGAGGWEYVAFNLHHGQLKPEWFTECFPGLSLFDLVGDHSMFFLLLYFFGAKFGPSPMAHTRFIHPRRAPEDKNRFEGYGRQLGWHSDAQAHGAPRFTVNLWTPLEDCGEQRPGLRMVLLGHDEAYALSGIDEATGKCDPAARRQLNDDPAIFGGAPIFAPEMRRGDILFFTHWTIHGTYVTPEMSESRLSAELRFDYDGQAFPE
jgi:hypothetical protein